MPKALPRAGRPAAAVRRTGPGLGGHGVRELRKAQLQETHWGKDLVISW